MINSTIERIAALFLRSTFAYLFDMSQVLAAGRLALHLAITINQRLFK